MEVNNYMTTPITGQGLNVCIPPDDELSLTSKKPAQNKVITEELTDLSNAISQLQPTATASDVGKAIIVKTVDTQTGKPTGYEYGEAGGQTDIGLSVVNGQICVSYSV